VLPASLPPGNGDFSAFTSAEAGTLFNDPGGMQVRTVCFCSLYFVATTDAVASGNFRAWVGLPNLPG